MLHTDRDQITSFFRSFPHAICPTCRKRITYMTPPEKASCPYCGPIPCVCCGDQADVTFDTSMAADLCNRCRKEHGV